MQRRNPETITLKDILITAELSRRVSRAPNFQAENQAMRMLIHQMAQDSENLMQTLVDTVLGLCEAGTSGLSLLETTPEGAEIFRWNALSGTLAHHVGGSTPRDFSPCGVCLDQGSPVLFSHPERYFTYFQKANTPIVEGLVLPLVADRSIFGTIWIMSHDEQRLFDSEDVRIMTSLADFTAATLLLQQRQTKELLAMSATLEAEIAERKQAEEQTRSFIYRWFIVKASPLKDESGKVIKMYGAATDIHDRKQTEITLRESEEKYRSIFDAIDEGFCIYELIYDDDGKPIDLRWVEVNPAYEKQTGLKDTVGKRHSELSLNTESWWFEMYDQVAKTGEAVDFENWHEPTGRWYRVFASRLGNAGSCQVAVVFEDVTNRKHREANVTFLADLMNDLSSLTTVEDVMERAGKRITEHLNLSRYMFVEIFPEAGTCTYLLPSHPPGQLEISGSFVLAEYHTEAEHRLLCTGHSMIVNDVCDGTRTPEQIAAFEAFDIGSIVNTPYLSNGRWVFDLGVARSQPSVWREDEIELLWELSARIWLRIERARAEASLRKSEEKYRSLFNSIDEGFAIAEVIYDPSGQVVDILYLEANPAASHLIGVPDYTQRRLREIAPDFESYWFEIYDRIVRTGVSERTEYYAAPLNRWYDFYVFPTDAAEPGQRRRVAVIFQDISDRKHAEEKLHRAAEIDAFRVKLSDALRSLSDPVEIQRVAMRIVGESLQVDRVLYGDITPDGKMWIAQGNYTSGRLQKLLGSFPTAAFGASVGKLKRGELVITPNVENATDLTEAEKALYEAYNTRSVLGVPLIKDGRWISNIGIHHAEPREWTVAEIALVQETAERTWAAVERARAEAELRESQLQRVREQSAREQERQRAESLAELDRAKTLFFSNISHEFRTPLTLSLASLQDVLNDQVHLLVPVHRERLELVHRNSLRLLKLVNTLLDFSRIEAGRMEALYEPVDLSMFTAELASVFRSAIEQAGLQLIVDCPPLPEPVYVDREMWEKIVLNLLSNAFKFTFEGEITVSLSVESKINLQASTANHPDLTSDPQFSTSEHASLSSDLDAPTSEPDPLSSEHASLSSKLDAPTSEHASLSSELDAPTSEPDPLSSGLDAPTSEHASLSSELDAPTSEHASLSSELDTPTLEKQATTSNLHVILKICDSGTGIAAEHLPHLFERFYQVRGTRARIHEGSGIGLALVYELVRLHHGTLEVSSTVGEGTCFTIALPFGTAHLPSDRLRRGEAERVIFEHPNLESDRLQPTRTLASTTMRATTYVEEAERWLPSDDFGLPILDFGLESPDPASPDRNSDQLTNHPKSKIQNPKSKILFVDDNADMREYLTRILGEYVQVDAVADGTTALAVAQERIPDLILSDVMMPGLDGFELLRTLRTDPRTKEIPIILLSARAGEEAIVEGLKAGADDYLIKPFSAQELISRIHAHLQMAQLRGEALQEARSTIRSRDEFISVVSHELNTPLVSILGWTRILRSNPPKPAMLTKALDTIERNATLQAKLIQDLLDISHITAGKLRLNLQPIELQPVLETAIATVSQTAAEKGIHLTWQGNVAESIVVMGDGDRLCQVLTNLLTNAIKFTPEYGRVTLALTSASDAHALDTAYAEIRVIDTGIGIGADFLPHVFDRFRQVEGTSAAKGLGLGLAIARHIVELHHGTIQAESPGEGQGATFTVRIPRSETWNDER